MPIEIFEYEWYENNLFYLEQITLKKNAKLEIGMVSGTNETTKTTLEKVKKEFQEYDSEHHKAFTSESLWGIFEQIEEKLLSWDNVSEKFNKDYIDFKVNGKSFCSIEMQKKKIKINFGNKKKKEIQSSVLSVRDVSTIGKYGTGDFQIEISDNENILEVLSLLKQSYNSL